jgi:hypothetical protein
MLVLSTAIIFMLLRNYSTGRFWVAVHAANISMFFTFLGIYARLRVLRRLTGGFWRWEALAILRVMASGLTYEVFFPLRSVTQSARWSFHSLSPMKVGIGG